MEKSLRFYTDIVGLPIARRMKPNPEMEIVFLGSGETQVELIYEAKNKTVSFGRDISIGFVVKSLDAFTDLLKSAGVQVFAGPFQPNPSVKFIYVLDPDGLRVQFVQKHDVSAKYIALLRGVNVGGVVLKMEDFKKVLEYIGLQESANLYPERERDFRAF